MNAWSDWNSAEPNLPWPLIFTGMLFNNIYCGAATSPSCRDLSLQRV